MLLELFELGGLSGSGNGLLSRALSFPSIALDATERTNEYF